MYKKCFKQMYSPVTLVLSLISSPEQQFDFTLLECLAFPLLPHSLLITLLLTSLKNEPEEDCHIIQGCTVHTSVYWAFPPCSDISKLSNPKVNMATPSFCLLKSTIQEPSLTPIFLSTLDSGSIRKSYQLSFQTRQDSDHLPLLLTLVQTIICRAGYTQPPCLWPCRGLQSVTIRQAQHPSHDVCSHHSE